MSLLSLCWCDVDPSTHSPFDPAAARSLTEAILLDAMSKKPPTLVYADLQAIELAISRALLTEYGAWIEGWSWGIHDGGPVRAWISTERSLLPRFADGSYVEKDPPRETLERVVTSTLEWRAYLEELDALFRTLSLPNVEANVETIERLLLFVNERSGAVNHMWQHHLLTVLSWYLEAKGHPVLLAHYIFEPIVEELPSGVADEATIKTVCNALAERIAEAPRRGDTEIIADRRRGWLVYRMTAFDNESFVPTPSAQYVPLRYDGHRRFINGPERTRDAARADAMEVALDLCRASASRDEPLTFERLVEWQAIVLGDPNPVVSDLDRATFDACLEEATDASVPIVVRAARAGLDVRLLRPFADGNARAARLAFDHVLTRAGLGLHAAEMIFALARNANDSGSERDAFFVALHLDRHVGPYVQ